MPETKPRNRIPKDAPMKQKKNVLEVFFHQGVTFNKSTYNQCNPRRMDQKNLSFDVVPQGVVMKDKRAPELECLIPHSNIRYMVCGTDKELDRIRKEDAKKRG